MAILEKNTLWRYQGVLLRKMDGDSLTASNSLNWTLSYNPYTCSPCMVMIDIIK